MLGQVRRAAAQAAEAAESSLRSISDNPVYVLHAADHPDGRILSTGGYHDARAPAALDAVAASAVDLADIAQHVLFQLFYPPGGGVMSELRYHRSLTTMVANAHVEDARRAAGHSSSGIGSPGQNDVVSPAFLAWDAQERAGSACEATLAILAACAVHTLVGDGRAVASSVSATARRGARDVPGLGARRLVRAPARTARPPLLGACRRRVAG